MTEGGHGEEPLTPDEEATVARMLADAAGPLRMPDDVVARLDGVLADLERERSATAGAEVVVVELRARRRWPRVLVAAAAVVVGGYAVGTVATQGTLSGSDDGMGAAYDSAGSDGGSSGAEQPGNTSQEASGGDTEAEEPPDDLAAPEAAGGEGDGGSDARSEQSTDAMVLRTVRLRSDRLDVGVRRALRVLETHPHPTNLLKGFATGDTTCTTPELGRRDRYLPVRYDGEEAVLVAGPEREGTVEVTVWSCAGDELDSTLVRP